jgi:hypothetical protein
MVVKNGETSCIFDSWTGMKLQEHEVYRETIK